MRTWDICFSYNGIKYILFEVKAALIDLEGDFPKEVCVGSVDKDGDFIPDELLISKIITFYASVDRKGVKQSRTTVRSFRNMKDQSIYAKIWVE
jgi:hypothetical protein